MKFRINVRRYKALERVIEDDFVQNALEHHRALAWRFHTNNEANEEITSATTVLLHRWSTFLDLASFVFLFSLFFLFFYPRFFIVELDHCGGNGAILT